MPRVYEVKKTRKDQGNCGKCGCAIKKGDPYRYWEFRVSVGKSWASSRRVRCMKPECSPKPKDLTNSPFYSTLYQIQETTFAAEEIDDLESQRDEVVGELENLKDEVQGSLDNMPEGLQQGDTGQMMQERIDALEEAISNLEGVDISWDEPEKEDDEKDEAFDLRKEDEKKERIEEICGELDGYLQDISC